MFKVNNSELTQIQKEYENYLREWIAINTKCKLQRIIDKYRLSDPCYSNMITYLKMSFDKIIFSKFSELEDVNIAFNHRFSTCITYYKSLDTNLKKQSQFGKFKIKMAYLYKSFFLHEILINNEKISIGRWLSSQLNLKVCPYCNHNYVFTLNNNKDKIFLRPQFDHFYSKSYNPILALSFFNLVPSCYSCNFLKKEKKITFSPYDLDIFNDFNFSINFDEINNPNNWGNSLSNINIKLKSTISNDNITVLGLADIYNEHKDYVQEIVNKAYSYNNNQYEAMISSFKGLSKTPEQIDTLIWGAYLDQNDNRPLSKFTADILKQLKIK